jgi:hypothetical protein
MKPILLTLVTIAFITSCSNSLTRKKAFELLNENYPKKLYYQIFTADQDYAANVKRAGLIKDGLITIDTNATFPNKCIFFTDNAKDLLVPTPEDEKELRAIQRVKVGEWKLKEITGINLSENKATVEYVHEISNITPFAKLYKNPPKVGETRKEVAYFIKYDDGWRLDKTNGLDFFN